MSTGTSSSSKSEKRRRKWHAVRFLEECNQFEVENLAFTHKLQRTESSSFSACNEYSFMLDNQ